MRMIQFGRQIMLRGEPRCPVAQSNPTRHFSVLRDAKGIAIVTVLMILMLLSVIAITFTGTTTTEKRIVRTEAVFERDFFKAESGAMEGVQKLANTNDQKELMPNVGGAIKNAGLLASVKPRDQDSDVAMIDNDGNGKFDDADLPGWDDSEIDGDTFRRVVLPEEESTRHSEESYSMGGSSMIKKYSVFGYSGAENGQAMVKIGYKKMIPN